MNASVPILAGSPPISEGSNSYMCILIQHYVVNLVVMMSGQQSHMMIKPIILSVFGNSKHTISGAACFACLYQ